MSAAPRQAGWSLLASEAYAVKAGDCADGQWLGWCRPFVPWDGCAACWKNEDHKNILLCDGCDLEYHYYCMQPPLPDIPTGEPVFDKSGLLLIELSSREKQLQHMQGVSWESV